MLGVIIGRLPTIEEFKELKENCKWECDEENKGMRVTGPNGNSIFLPAGGRPEKVPVQKRIRKTQGMEQEKAAHPVRMRR